MVSRVQSYRTKQGKLFDDRVDALLEEAREELDDIYEKESHDSPCDKVKLFAWIKHNIAELSTIVDKVKEVHNYKSAKQEVQCEVEK